MQCANHPTEAATAICTRCDKLLCAACGQDMSGKTFCAACAEYLGQRAQHRRPAASPAAGGGAGDVYQGPPPAGDVYQGPPPGQGASPAGFYQGPPPGGAQAPTAGAAQAPSAGAPRPPAIRPQQAPPLPRAPAAAPKPAAGNPYQSQAPSSSPKPPAAANPYESQAPSLSPKPPAATNPYQAVAPGSALSPAPANPYQAPAPPAPPAAPPSGSIGLRADPLPAPPAGDVYQGRPAGDVFQDAPPAGDVYQGPPGDVYQGPPPGDVYQEPPAEGVYQGPPAGGVPQTVAGLPMPAEEEGSLGKAAVTSAVVGIIGVLISWGISAATGKILKLSSVWLFIGPMIGRTAVQGAGRGGGDVALLAAGVTIGALFLAEIIVGYQRGYIEVDLFDWVFWGIGGYWAYRIPAERA